MCPPTKETGVIRSNIANIEMLMEKKESELEGL